MYRFDIITNLTTLSYKKNFFVIIMNFCISKNIIKFICFTSILPYYVFVLYYKLHSQLCSFDA